MVLNFYMYANDYDGMHSFVGLFLLYNLYVGSACIGTVDWSPQHSSCHDELVEDGLPRLQHHRSK